jgi:hypothetical protein
VAKEVWRGFLVGGYAEVGISGGSHGVWRRWIRQAKDPPPWLDEGELLGVRRFCLAFETKF